MAARRFLTLQQFCDLHPGLSMTSLRRYIRRGQIDHVQPGGPGTLVLIPEDALDRLRSSSGTALSCTEEPEAHERVTHAVADEEIHVPNPTTTPHSLPGPRPRWQR